MAERVASLRGSAIECYGSADLVRVDATGRRRWLMQADEVLYLHPDRVRLKGPAIEVDRDPLPDVVLEVDHTTDVRRRKLDIYKESGFPGGVGAGAVGFRRGARRGSPFTCAGVTGIARSGRAGRFAGWRAEEIHLALTEAPMSEIAWRALERVALSMGAREGTEPEDDPLMQSQSVKARTEGRMEMVVAALRARGIEAALDGAEDRALLGGVSGDALMAAALACTDAADFRRRVGERSGGSDPDPVAGGMRPGP